MARASFNSEMDGWSMISSQSSVESQSAVAGHQSPFANPQPPDRPVSADRGAGTAKLLIADDQPDVLEALRLLLKGEGYKIESAGSPAGILEAIDGDDFDAVLMDLNYARDTTSGQE